MSVSQFEGAVTAEIGEVPACSICGGTRFAPAPNNRLSANGLPPRCVQCGSLERHRIFRAIFDKIRSPEYRNKKALQFSRDPSAAGGWFAERETSIYGGENSLDIQNIARPDGAYDIVICNHVIEHVEDYRAAIRELARITATDGFVFLSFPNPYGRKVTEDWGYPKPEQHLHYRIFGRDIEAVFARIIPACHVIAVTAQDPVTGQSDMAYILTRSDTVFTDIFHSGISARIAQIRKA